MEKWEKQFNENFPLYPDFSEKGNKYYASLRREIKSFIRTTRRQVIEEMLELIEAERLQDATGEPEDIAYNQAIDDVVESGPVTL